MLAFVLILSALIQSQGGAQRLPALSSLVEGCRVELGVLGARVPIGQRDGIWLTCQGVRFLVVRPENLASKVHIHTVEQALEFVRFFSSRSTFGPLQAGGCVEVTDDPGHAGLYVVAPRIFSRHLRQPKVTSFGSTLDREFSVVRALVCPDQRVYEVSEQIGSDGTYVVFAKRQILKSARTIGVVHYPAH